MTPLRVAFLGDAVSASLADIGIECVRGDDFDAPNADRYACTPGCCARLERRLVAAATELLSQS